MSELSKKIIMEQEIYKGKLILKFTEANHAYYIKENKPDAKWERKSGATTYGGIKDKSAPLKFWVAKITVKFLLEILSKRAVTKFDLEEARKLHTVRLQEAATAGNKIHDWCELYVKGKKPPMPEEDDVLIGVNAFLDWVTENKVKFVSAERLLYSMKYDYCGAADAVARLNGKKDLYLIDYKTSGGLYNDVMMQTAAYSKVHEEMGYGKIKGRYAVRLEKRTAEQFQLEMDEKGKPNEIYQPFEALYLDGEVREEKQGRKTVLVPTGKHDKALMDLDFDAYLHACGLFRWNKGSEKRINSYKIN